MAFEIYFSIKIISKMNDNSSEWKISFVYFHSINVKGNWTHLTEQNSRPGAKITTIFKLSWKYFNRIIIKNIFKASVLLWTSRLCCVI